MYRSLLSVLAGLLAAGAFALTPGTALAQHHGGGHGGGGHAGGGHWSGGGGHAYYGGGRNYGGGRYYGNRGWGWGGVGIGLGLGSPWYGYGGYGPGYSTYSQPYYYGDGGTYYDATPYYSGDMSPDNAMPAYGDSGYAYGDAGSAQDNMAHVRVIVPPDAKVWFDDNMTKQTGTVRNFESPPLTPGREFTYNVKAKWRDANGKDVTQSRPVDVRANSNATVDFTNR